MRSIVSLNVFASDSNSEIIKHLTAEKLKSYRLPFPPLDEQIHIANFLDQENSKINELLKITQSSIETLENYRQALITAAVTGKIDVREAVEL
jgi:type I restriction enzyme S subunit